MNRHTFSQLRLAMPAIAFIVALPSVARDDSSAYRFDIGGGIGMSGYLGEANSSFLFARPGVAANIQGRYIFNDRTALRAQCSVLTLSGDTRGIDNVFPEAAYYSFSSTVTAFDVRGEFNFLPYGIGESYRHLSVVTPFVSAGCGLNLSASEGSTFSAFAIPLSLGVKYKPAPRWNLIAEFSMTKVFGDHLDGPALADLNGIPTSLTCNSDWHSSLTVGFTYQFGPRCEACNRLD